MQQQELHDLQSNALKLFMMYDQHIPLRRTAIADTIMLSGRIADNNDNNNKKNDAFQLMMS